MIKIRRKRFLNMFKILVQGFEITGEAYTITDNRITVLMRSYDFFSNLKTILNWSYDFSRSSVITMRFIKLI